MRILAHNPRLRNKRTIVLSLILMLLVAGISAPYVINTIQNIQASAEGASIKQKLRNVLSGIKLNGTVVYEKVSELGCEPKGREVQLTISKSVTCAYQAERIYKNNQSLLSDLVGTDKKITGAGWLGFPDYSGESYIQRSINERQAGGVGLTLFTMSYITKGATRLPNLGIEAFQPYDTGQSAKQNMGLDADIPLGDGEYLYRITVGCNYKMYGDQSAANVDGNSDAYRRGLCSNL